MWLHPRSDDAPLPSSAVQFPSSHVSSPDFAYPGSQSTLSAVPDAVRPPRSQPMQWSTSGACSQPMGAHCASTRAKANPSALPMTMCQYQPGSPVPMPCRHLGKLPRTPRAHRLQASALAKCGRNPTARERATPRAHGSKKLATQSGHRRNEDGNDACCNLPRMKHQRNAQISQPWPGTNMTATLSTASATATATVLVAAKVGTGSTEGPTKLVTRRSKQHNKSTKNI